MVVEEQIRAQVEMLAARKYASSLSVGSKSRRPQFKSWLGFSLSFHICNGYNDGNAHVLRLV